MTKTMKTPEEILEEARKMIGKETKPKKFAYPIEYEPIRRYCMMVDDDNPLYLDPEYAKKTQYGGVVFPPLAAFGIMPGGSPENMRKIAENQTGEEVIMPPTPGKYLINLSQEWEWFKPVLVGDWLTMKSRLKDVYIKPIKIDPKAFWVVLEWRFCNQKNEDVCIARNINVCHRSPEEVAADI